MEITINQNENQLISISNNNLQQIGIEQNDNQLITINNSNSQDIDINQHDNQTILIDGGGVVIGITDVLVNGVSVVSGNTAYVIVPTRTSELQNNSGFITQESDPTVPNVVKQITLADINNWNSKQNALVSGSTIKTINNESLLGSGNIQISGTQYSAGYGIDITNDIITNVITSYNDLVDLPTIPSKTSDLINDSDFVSENELAEVAFDGSYASLSNTPTIPDSTSELINDGNGTYPFMLNKAPSYIDGIGLYGGSSAYARNLSYVWDSGAVTETKLVANYDDIPTNTSQLTNDSNFAVTNADNSFSSNQTVNANLECRGLQCRSIEIGGPSQPPYIDFHFNNDFSVDYTSRIIESSSGTLNIVANLNINGLPVLVPHVLYDNSSGSNTSVTLNDNASNYSYMEIYFRSNDGQGFIGSQKVNNPNGKKTCLLYNYFAGGALYIKSCNADINGTTITLSGQTETSLVNGNVPSISSTNNVYIVKVVGY